jgi:hypothetical protein
MIKNRRDRTLRSVSEALPESLTQRSDVLRGGHLRGDVLLHCRLRQREWVTHTIFTRATFENFVPDFRGATMHEATEWHGPSWPKPPQDKGAAQEQVYAYECLKLEMERGSRSTRMSCNFSAGSCVRAADCSSLGPGLTLVAVGVNFDVHLPPRCSE